MESDKAHAEMAGELTRLLESEAVPGWAKYLIRETTTKADLAEKFDSLETNLGKMERSIQSVTNDCKAALHRVSNVETRVSALEDSGALEAPKVELLGKEVSKLTKQVDDLIGRSKRNNIRILSIREGAEASNMDSFLNEILKYVLDLGPGQNPPEVDRAHRAPRARPDPGEPSRPIYVRMLRWADRQRILQAAGKKSLTWGGVPFYIRQDLSPQVIKQRATYDNVISKIKDHDGLRFGILHPARLIVTLDGQKSTYDTASEAEQDLKTRLPNLDW